jgi:hypothetical protein
VAAGVGLATAAYATYAAVTWARYGATHAPAAGEADALLDHFMPVYDVVERHHVRVHAPVAVTFAAACDMDLRRSAVINAVFKGREWIMRSGPGSAGGPHAMIPQMLAIGWRILAEVPGRVIVMGAVTQPWQGNVVFRGLSPDAFVRFDEPDYVKIAWTLRADPAGDDQSMFRTETRAVATSAVARAKFRRYWAFLSPGIWLIRRMSLGLVRADAERRAEELAMFGKDTSR